MRIAYSISLVLSAVVFGSFVRAVVSDLGFALGTTPGYLLAGGAAGVYASLQLLFVAIVQLLLPTGSRSFFAAEFVSHLTIIVLFPYVAGASIAWPHPYLVQAEPLVYLGVFGVLHGFAKLATIYATLHGTVARRTGGLIALGLSGVCMIAGIAGLSKWLPAAEKEWPKAGDTLSAYRVGQEYAWARSVPEGVTYRYEMEDYDGQQLTVRWALPDGFETLHGNTETIYVSLTFDGDKRRIHETSASLRDDGWAEVRVPESSIPDHVRRCSIRWTRTREPGWFRKLGLHPVIFGNGTQTEPLSILMSGPFEHRSPSATGTPSVLLILVEGLSAKYLSLLGHDKPTTPMMDAFGQEALVFPNAQSPSASVLQASMSALTGQPPDTIAGRSFLPELLRDARYLTVAFTEGEGPDRDDLDWHSGIASGFEIFNPHYDSQRGSAATLERLRVWLRAHRTVNYFAFVRLREMRTLTQSERYGPGFVEEGKNPRPVDEYEAALLYLDAQLGEVFDTLRKAGSMDTTCVIVTSPYGHDFALGKSGAKRDTPTLRVPILLRAPGVAKVRRLESVELADLAPTIAALTGVDWPNDAPGRNLLSK
ncbi:MAG: sulfatase-like hydrolase/transferase [Candidatus Hydrogenedentes bacterium]|nr:sulfatase-like hydrolase/transferase [Candidatus Hydrogenedentota bacterium]